MQRDLRDEFGERVAELQRTYTEAARQAAGRGAATSGAPAALGAAASSRTGRGIDELDAGRHGEVSA